MLVLCPARRISLKDAMNHRFFTEHPLPISQDRLPKAFV